MLEDMPLDFEKPIKELEKKISDMKDLSLGENIKLDGEIASMEKKLGKLRVEVYSNLSRWQKVLISRHPRRPHTLDYVSMCTTEFVELHGDRGYRDDKAIVGGLARIDGRPVMIVGQQKGRSTKEKLFRNFGMGHPEGYRKARRLFYLAEKFNIPIVILIDTPGAYPGIEAEERGQAEAIAKNIKIMFQIKVPIVISIIGEGASGGALGIGIGDKVLMMEYAWYSVISPEGCAAILWRDPAKAPEAAEALKVVSSDLMNLRIVDKIIPEPATGAHSDAKEAAATLKGEILLALDELKDFSVDELLARRLEKYRVMGEFEE